MTRPISLAALTVLELTPPERVSCAAEAGFSHAGVRLIPATPTEPQYDVAGDPLLLREVERRLADTGIEVLDCEIFRLKPDTRIADYEAAIASAARLGASELLVAGNDPDESRLADRFGAFCDLAARYRLAASLEFMPWTDAKDLPQAARIVERAGRANGGVLVDAFHFSRSHSRLCDLESLAPSRLRFMQLCDVPAEVPPTMDAIVVEARAERLFPRRRRARPARPAACAAARAAAQRRGAGADAGAHARRGRARRPRAARDAGAAGAARRGRSRLKFVSIA